MHSVAFLQDLALVMIVAGVVTVTFHVFKLPVVLGYLLAGVIIGPHILPRPLIVNEESIHTLAELGVIFLLFALGLEFNFRKLRQIGVAAFIIAPLETGVMFFAGYQLGQIFGWSATDSVYLGGILMISSTTIITKTLAELGKTREEFAEVIFGILIAEDIIAILLIASLSGVAMTGTVEVTAILGTIGRLAIFLVAAVVLGLLVVPRLVGFVARLKNQETLLVTVLGLAFGLALLAVKLGYSVALGAFVMGAVIAESREIHHVERLVAPVRDMFSAVFFVAIGLLIDPALIIKYALPVTIISVVLVLGKILACSFGSFVAGYDRPTSLRVGLGLAQIGEFSFIIAALGQNLKVTSDFLYPIAVGVSAITTALTPFLIRHADKAITWHDRLAPRSLLNYQHDYFNWMSHLQNRKTSKVRQLVHKMLLQLGINAALIAGCFIAAVFVDTLRLEWMKHIPPWMGGSKTVLWLAAMLLSLPLLMATVRKLQALGMLLSEMSVTTGSHQGNKVALRAMISNTTLFIGVIALGLLILLLSSALLPPWKILFVLVAIAILLAMLLRTFFSRIYSRAQVSIRETLASEPMAPAVIKPVPALMEAADLATVRLSDGGVASGRLIRDLQLRTLTGASIVVVKRGDDTTINPGPETELRADDELLLLGTNEQLQAAQAFLGEKVKT